MSNDHLPQRLRCKYPSGPILANGEPEFGWRDMSGPTETFLPTPIMVEAAVEIERLRAALNAIKARINGVFDDPDLTAFGLLSVDHDDDVLAIVAATERA